MAALGGGVALFAACPVYAGDLGPAEQKLWKEMLREGIDAEKADRCGDAVEVFKQVAAMRETSEVLLHMGECQAHDGKLVDALKTWEHAEDLARSEKSKSMQQTLSTKLGSLRERIPTVLLQIPEDVTKPVVKVDGEPLASERVSSPIQLDPGEHTFEVTAQGRVPFSKKVKLDEKDSSVIPVSLANPASNAPSGGSSGVPLGTWIAGSAALVLAAGGVASSVVAGSTASDGETQCATLPRCDQKAIDSVRQLDAAALGLWIGAGVGAGLAVTLWALDRPQAKTTGKLAPTRALPPPRVVFGPTAIRLEGAF